MASGMKNERPTRRLRRFLPLALIVLCITPRVLSAGVSNQSAIILVHTLLDGQAVALDRVIASLPWVSSISTFTSTSHADSSNGRAALLGGDYDLAAAAWGLTNVAADQRPRATVERFLHEEPIPAPTLRDAISYRYLQRADSDLHSGNIGRAQSLLEGVLLLRPSDIYAHYRLMHLALDAGHAELAQHHADALRVFPLEAIQPVDASLITYVEGVLQALIDEKIWTTDQAERVVTFLVWKFSAVPNTSALLEQLSSHYRTEARWPFYLGETYQRRGDWGHAEQAYRQALERDKSYTLAELRLGTVTEAAGATPRQVQAAELLNQAYGWYLKYHTSVPDDIFGLQKLATLAAQLDKPEAKELADAVKRATDEREVAARLLKTDPQQVGVGALMNRYGSFEPWTPSQAQNFWTWLPQMTTPTFDRAFFVGDIDTLDPEAGDIAVRVDGLWDLPKTGRNRSRAGFWSSRVIIPKGSLTLITFSYRTSISAGSTPVGLWLTSDIASQANDELFLPPTNGAWHREALILHNITSQPVQLRPSIRNWGMQTLWVDQVEIRPLEVPQGMISNVPVHILSWQPVISPQ